MSRAAVAQRYAQAVFEIGVESGQLDRFVRELDDFAQTYRNSSELSSVLDNPLVSQEQRDSVLTEVASRVGLAGAALSVTRLLARRKKLRALPELARRLAVLADQHAGVVRAAVTSAFLLPEWFYERLQTQLETAIDRKVVLDRRQDPSLIAGVVTRIGDYTIDGSVQGRLAEIERQLKSA